MPIAIGGNIYADLINHKPAQRGSRLGRMKAQRTTSFKFLTSNAIYTTVIRNLMQSVRASAWSFYYQMTPTAGSAQYRVGRIAWVNPIPHQSAGEDSASSFAPYQRKALTVQGRGEKGVLRICPAIAVTTINMREQDEERAKIINVREKRRKQIVFFWE